MELLRKHDKSSGAFAFVLNFLWLLSLFQEVTIYELDHGILN